MIEKVHPVLERVARAIYDRRAELRAENDRRLAKDGFWPDRHYQPSEIDLARAAVQALMEPTQDMIDNSLDLETREERRRSIYVMALRPLVEGEG